MSKIVYNLVYNRRKRLNRKGMALVQVEAYLNRKRKLFSTRIYLRPEQWNSRKRLVRNHPNAEALNRLLYDFVALLERKELELWQRGRAVSLEQLKEAFDSHENLDSFLVFFRQGVAESPLKESTRRNHLSTLALLREFRHEVAFSEVTFDFVLSFEHFLVQKGFHTNTIAKHMRHLKRHVNAAINKDLIDLRHYAFRKYKIKTVEYRHSHLSPEELERLERLELQGRDGHYRKMLDAFLFCCYTGMRYSDFTSLTPGNIVEMDHETWLVYRSIKTGTEVRLPLYLLFGGKGLSILRKYQHDMQKFFRLPDNSNVNKVLAQLSRLCGLSKRISFHTARHTNATLLIYSGVSITTVQKLLGHKSVKTTQIYASIMDKTLVSDLKRNGSLLPDCR